MVGTWRAHGSCKGGRSPNNSRGLLRCRNAAGLPNLPITPGKSEMCTSREAGSALPCLGHERIEGGLSQRTGRRTRCTYLVDLMPAILIFAAHRGMLVEEELTAVGVAPHDRSVVQGCEAVTVFIIRRCSKLQQGLGKTPNTVVTGHDPFCRVYPSRKQHGWGSFASQPRLTRPLVPGVSLGPPRIRRPHLTTIKFLALKEHMVPGYAGCACAWGGGGDTADGGPRHVAAARGLLTPPCQWRTVR